MSRYIVEFGMNQNNIYAVLDRGFNNSETIEECVTEQEALSICAILNLAEDREIYAEFG